MPTRSPNGESATTERPDVLPAQVDHDDAAIGVGLVVVDGLRWARTSLERELETWLLMALRTLAFFSLPDLLDDEWRKHRFLLG